MRTPVLENEHGLGYVVSDEPSIYASRRRPVSYYARIRLPDGRAVHIGTTYSLHEAQHWVLSYLTDHTFRAKVQAREVNA